MDKGILVLANLTFLAFVALLAILLTTNVFINLVASILIFFTGFMWKEKMTNMPKLTDLKQI